MYMYVNSFNWIMLNVSIILKGKDYYHEVERYNVDAAMETIWNRLPHVSVSLCAYNYYIVRICGFQNADLPTFHLETTPTEKIFSE